MSNMNIHNYFEFYLEHEDKTKEKIGQAYNTALKSSKDSFVYGISGANYQKYGILGIALGGGTNTPTPDDTKLQNQYRVDNVELTFNDWEQSLDAYVIKGKKEYTTTDLAGATITEVGACTYHWRSSYGGAHYLMTRALITDSAGNVIAINKSGTDKLIVYMTVYLKRTKYKGLIPPSYSFPEMRNHNIFGNYATSNYCLQFMDPIAELIPNKAYASYTSDNVRALNMCDSVSPKAVGLPLIPYFRNSTGITSNGEQLIRTFNNTEENNIKITHYCFQGNMSGMSEIQSIGKVDITTAILGIGDGVTKRFPIVHAEPSNISVYIDTNLAPHTLVHEQPGLNLALYTSKYRDLCEYGGYHFSKWRLPPIPQSMAIWDNYLYFTGFVDGHEQKSGPIYGQSNWIISLPHMEKTSDGYIMTKVDNAVLKVTELDVQYTTDPMLIQGSVTLHPTQKFIIMNLHGYMMSTKWDGRKRNCYVIGKYDSANKTITEVRFDEGMAYFNDLGTKMVVIKEASNPEMFNVSFANGNIVLSQVTVTGTFKNYTVVPNKGTLLSGNTFAYTNYIWGYNTVNISPLGFVTIDWATNTITSEVVPSKITSNDRCSKNYYVRMDRDNNIAIYNMADDTINTVVKPRGTVETKLYMLTESDGQVFLETDKYKRTFYIDNGLLKETTDYQGYQGMWATSQTIIWEQMTIRFIGGLYSNSTESWPAYSATNFYKSFGEVVYNKTYVEFDTAPAAGKTITANYQLDYLPKDENWTFTVNASSYIELDI